MDRKKSGSLSGTPEQDDSDKENDFEVWSRFENQMKPMVNAIIEDGVITSEELRLTMSVLKQFGIDDNMRNQEMVERYLQEELAKLEREKEKKKKEEKEKTDKEREAEEAAKKQQEEKGPDIGVIIAGLAASIGLIAIAEASVADVIPSPQTPAKSGKNTKTIDID